VRLRDSETISPTVGVSVWVWFIAVLLRQHGLVSFITPVTDRGAGM
jgi:hypothetical protein